MRESGRMKGERREDARRTKGHGLGRGANGRGGRCEVGRSMVAMGLGWWGRALRG